MAQFSFDIVSQYDKAELNNVFDQAARELASRYDFKNTPAAIEWLSPAKDGFLLSGNGQYQIDAIIEIIRKKLAARGQSQKLLDTSLPPTISNLITHQEIRLKTGLDQAKAKQISALIRSAYPKVKALIQNENIRVSSPSKDELQAVMQLIRSHDFDFPLSFDNFH